MKFSELLSNNPERPEPRESRRKDSRAGSKNIAALILAAGQSKRMGQDNKLLLPYDGGSLLSHLLDQVKQAGIRDIFVVTGHQKNQVEQEISRYDVTPVHNDFYQEGISTSVKRGIAALPKEIDGVMIMLGDMPNISADILNRIIAAYHSAPGQTIIIPTYNGKRGNPILWDRGFFSDFKRLDGDMGAKTLLGDYPEYITEVDAGSEAIFLDIDTLDAYQRHCK